MKNLKNGKKIYVNNLRNYFFTEILTRFKMLILRFLQFYEFGQTVDKKQSQ